MQAFLWYNWKLYINKLPTCLEKRCIYTGGLISIRNCTLGELFAAIWSLKRGTSWHHQHCFCVWINAPADTILLNGVTKMSYWRNRPTHQKNHRQNTDLQTGAWIACSTVLPPQWLSRVSLQRDPCECMSVLHRSKALCKASKTQRLLAATLWSLDRKAVRERNNPGEEQSFAQCTVILVHRGGRCEWWHKQYESIKWTYCYM